MQQPLHARKVRYASPRQRVASCGSNVPAVQASSSMRPRATLMPACERASRPRGVCDCECASRSCVARAADGQTVAWRENMYMCYFLRTRLWALTCTMRFLGVTIHTVILLFTMAKLVETRNEPPLPFGRTPCSQGSPTALKAVARARSRDRGSRPDRRRPRP